MVQIFERYTDRSRRVIVLAQEEARMLNHNYLGTEHILLGLIHENEGIAAQVLTDLGVLLEGTRLQVEGIVGKGQTPPTGHIPFTLRAKKVLELSLREALMLDHNYIGTEHLMLGLVREGEGVGARVLSEAGIGLDVARKAVIEKIVGSPQPTPPAKPILSYNVTVGTLTSDGTIGTFERRVDTETITEAIDFFCKKITDHGLTIHHVEANKV